MCTFLFSLDFVTENLLDIDCNNIGRCNTLLNTQYSYSASVNKQLWLCDFSETFIKITCLLLYELGHFILVEVSLLYIFHSANCLICRQNTNASLYNPMCVSNRVVNICRN